MKQKIKRVKINQENVKKINKALLFVRITVGILGFILSLGSICLVLYAVIYGLQHIGG